MKEPCKNTRDLAARVARENDYLIKDVEPIVKSVFEVLGNMILEGEEVYIHDFGKFQLKLRDTRHIYHPSTHEPLTVPPRYSLRFSLLPKYKDRIRNLPSPEAEQ